MYSKAFLTDVSTVEAPNKLPQGTYYYVIEYTDERNQQQSKVGWLYIKK